MRQRKDPSKEPVRFDDSDAWRPPYDATPIGEVLGESLTNHTNRWAVLDERANARMRMELNLGVKHPVEFQWDLSDDTHTAE